tara:strand:+ start:1072 stop:1272 length:201 start_codon:yes stop_codon:yes gene_type:complete
MVLTVKGERMSKNIDDMSPFELINELSEICDGYAVYMKHIRRYYPEVHNKTVSTKTFCEANKENNG